MFKNMARANRRHHNARLKKKRHNYWGFGKNGWSGYFRNKKMNERFLGIVLNTPTPCSCWMCRNPRHNHWDSKKQRLTFQEKKALENYKNNMEEI